MASDEPAGPPVALVEATGAIGASADGWTALFSSSGELLAGTSLTRAGAPSLVIMLGA